MTDENPKFYIRIEEGAYDASLQTDTTPTVARILKLGAPAEINRGVYDADHAVDTTPTVARIPTPDSGSASGASASSE